MVQVGGKLILGAILGLSVISYFLVSTTHHLSRGSNTHSYSIHRTNIPRSNSQSIDDVVNTEVTHIKQNNIQEQTTATDQVFSQEDYLKQKEKVDQKEDQIFNKFGFKRDPQDPYQLKTLFFYWYLRYGVTIENPFEYNDKIKSFAENAVKNIDHNNHEERIKAVYLSMQKKLEDPVALSKHVNISWDAKKSMECFEENGEFPNDCNVTDYLFGSFMNSLGYDVREARVLTDVNGTVISEIGDGKNSHICIIMEINGKGVLIDNSYSNKDNPLRGFDIKHKKAEMVNYFQSIEIYLHERRDTIERLEAQAFLEYKVL